MKDIILIRKTMYDEKDNRIFVSAISKFSKI